MRRTLAAVAVMCLAVMWPRAVLAGSAPAVFPPDSSPYGMTYPQWMASYEKWIQEIPTPENPNVHPNSPLNCAVQGDVVFLGTSGTGHGCTVPPEKGLLFSAATWECSTAEGLGDTFAELRACAKHNFRRDLGHEAVRLQLQIDGIHVPHARDWTFLGPGQIVDLPDDNIWGAPGGPTKSITKGFLFLVAPLSIGEHLIMAHATFPDGFKVHIGYRVNVAP